MKLATFKVNGSETFGLVNESGFIDAKKHLPGCNTLKEALGVEHLSKLKELSSRQVDHGFDASALLQPIVPGKVFCVLLNYESSRLAQGRPKLQYPHIVTRFPDCHVGPGQALIKPSATAEFDFEGEIAVFCYPQVGVVTG